MVRAIDRVAGFQLPTEVTDDTDTEDNLPGRQFSAVRKVKRRQIKTGYNLPAATIGLTPAEPSK